MNPELTTTMTFDEQSALFVLVIYLAGLFVSPLVFGLADYPSALQRDPPLPFCVAFWPIAVSVVVWRGLFWLGQTIRKKVT